MKRNKLAALLLSGCITLSAMPLCTVHAAEEEPETMKAEIALNGTSVTATGSDVKVEGTTVTITASGSYSFSGTLNDGQIVVNIPDITADSGTVKLFFNGVDMTGVTKEPLYIQNAEKTSINLVDGSVNTLSDGGKYQTSEAVIYAKDDLTIKGGTEGTGKLTINAVYQHAIQCNNDLKITGGDIKIRTNDGDGKTTGTGDAIRGKQSVEIKGGKLDIHAGGDGVKSTKGYVLISGGDTEIKASNDAVQGETDVKDSKTGETTHAVEITGGSLKANGDRGLTNAAAGASGGGPITITGGSVFATATDAQMKVAEGSQPTLLVNLKDQQVKDQRIELFAKDAEKAAFSRNPNKKFDYILISDGALKAGTEYTLKIAGAPAENGTFTLAEGVTEISDVTSTATAPTGPNYDVDDNGMATVGDAVIIARLAAQDSDLETTPDLLERADLNGDSIHDGSDLMMILRHLARLD